MKDLIDRINAFMADFRAKANAALSAMPPLDQIQAGEEVLRGLRCLNWAKDEIEDAERRVTEISNSLDAYVERQVSSRIEAGQLIAKEQHDSQISAARENERQTVEQEKDGEIAALRRMEGNRRMVTEALPAVVAAQVSDEVLQMEDITPALNELKRRVAELGKVGLSAELEEESKRKVFTRKVFCGGLDEDGRKLFDEEISDLVALGAGSSAPAPGPDGQAAAARRSSSQPPVTPAGGGEEDTPAKRPSFAF